jgi:branched-chain amino acid transport system ATP-binding protein
MTVTDRADGRAVLRCEDVEAGYGKSVVLRGIDLKVEGASVVALLGPNGAGKTTLLRTVSGLVRSTGGHIALGDVDVTRLSPHRRARIGLCHIPEGRGIFRSLSVKDNLELQTPPWKNGASLDPCLAAFPSLGRRMRQVAGSLSGGEQQMLALARAYLTDPVVVLVDEVSMGLAPIVVDEIFESLRRLADEGVALLLVEQYVDRALDLADYVYLINQGQITFGGPPGELDRDALMQNYLGTEISPTQTDLSRP